MGCCCGGKDDKDLREVVRTEYGKVAQRGGLCCGGDAIPAGFLAAGIGYDAEELSGVPDGANMGFSCGNPTAIISHALGEAILDLGAGGGF